MCGQNVLRGRKGESVHFWHVDEVVEFPLPDEIPRHDPRIKMPVVWLTVQIALTDVNAVEYGPTLVVRGSHYSGRAPRYDDVNPTFEGEIPNRFSAKPATRICLIIKCGIAADRIFRTARALFVNNQYCRAGHRPS